ncbi:MAG: tetratricopeptide repeat protein, partial [Candidatus Desulfatibia sp.]|uniref:tetratricopeptide repeat protein n=1 Tax=Candidatus Desulfatibia sp. TaxID=3101189 RepID=UPI002F3347DA
VLFISIIFCFPACASISLEVRKKQAEAGRNLGEAYLSQGDYTLALREFLKAKELYDNDRFLQDDLGLTYMAKGRLDLAIEHFRKALAIDPGYTPAKNNLGTAYMKKKDWDTAIKYFKEVAGELLYATPQFPLSNLGWAYYNKGEYELALKYYQEALEMNSQFLNALRGLGLTYIAMGKGPEAVAALEIGVKHYPQIAYLHFDLGEAYTLSRNYKKAFNAFQKVIALVPNTLLARKAKIESQKVKHFQ